MNEELSVEERQALDTLPREVAPPSELEDRTVQTLKDRGTLHRQQGSVGWRRMLAAAATVVLLLAGGAAAGRWTAAPVVAVAEQPEFLLLLRTGQEEAPGNDEEMMERVNEYSAWARAARQQGSLLTGEKLTEDGRLLSGAATALLEPGSGGEDGIQGYFLIRAPGYRQAVALASGCPHLKYGGRIEVRRIHKFTEESS
jgi:hypothetical protein